MARSGVNVQRNAPAAGIVADVESLILLKHQARILKLDLAKGVRSALAGQHQSKFRGRGMDYAESRHYQPGDDVRNIDWRVTARTGKTHTKLYIEERERPVFMLLDCSSSMYFGTRETLKSVLAARAAALLAWSTALNGDRVGGVIAGNKLTDIKPKSGRSGALSMINALSVATSTIPQQGTGSLLNTGLFHLSKVVHPGSLVFVFSDYYGLNKDSEKHLSTMRQHNNVVLCHITDPLELTPPRPGRYAVSDTRESNRIAILDTSTKHRRNQLQTALQHRENTIAEVAARYAIPLIQFCNGTSVVRTLLKHFVRNGR